MPRTLARRISVDARSLRVRGRVGVSVSDLPHAVLTPVDLRHTENVLPRLAVDRGLRSLVPRGVRHVTDHVRGDDLVLVRGAVRERVAETPEQVANSFLSDCRTGRAEYRHGLSHRPDRQPRARVAVVQRGLGLPQAVLR